VRTGISRTPLRWLLPVLGLVLAVRQWVWTPTLITGESMQPTLRGGQLAWVNKLAYRSRPPRRGDIVVVRTPQNWIVKRILGLPGEEIALRDGVCYVDGRPLAEPYVQFAGTDTTAPGRLGPNRFLVAGDYRAESAIAVVSRNRIVGGLVFRQKTPSKRG
jgi:signal peptidase I